jgi:hypothetical protein
MNAGQAKQKAAAWVGENIEQWPGIVGAHLVGGITTMPDDAPFPSYKDVDVHLIFEAGSPMLKPAGPFANMLEVPYSGLLIEAGIKPKSDYASAEAVLANPEISHHLTVDSVLLYDPDGWLRDLQALVKADYARRRWVQARIDFERKGLEGAFALRQLAKGMYGASGEVNVLGYSTTYIAATLCVAMLSAPSIGGRLWVRMRETLIKYDRLDLYDDLLELLGVKDVDRDQAQHFLEEGAKAFDRAVEIRRSPHPFQHKLHRHLRPYFVESCQTMIDEGFHREALGWTTPFVLSATDVTLVDGDESEKPEAAALQMRLLETLGLTTEDARDAKFTQATQLYEQYFALADEIVATNPTVVD